jgi:amino acid transporter
MSHARCSIADRHHATASSGRRVGLFGAAAIGIGGMVGGGIFAVLGEAASLAHGATPIAFAAAGAVALLTSYAYAKLSVRYPSQGGTVVFIDKAFGIDLATGTLNLILWLSYLVTLALYAVAFGSYGITLFPAGTGPWLRHVLICAAIVLPVAVNLLNAAVVSRSETLVVVLKLVLLAIVVGVGITHVDSSRLAPATWVTPGAMVIAGMVIFVAYEGFELIANSAGDVRDPERTLPRAFYGSVLLVIALYVLVALVTVGTLPLDRLPEVKDYALAEAAKPSLGQAGFTLVAISALLATASAINATVYGNARLGYTLAKEGELPDILERKAWNQPVSGVLVVGALAGLMANLIDLRAIAIISSAGFLLIFAVANAAAARLAGEIHARRWVALVACAACLGALIMLLVHAYHEDPRALWVFLSFLGVAFLFEVTYGRLRRGPLRLHHAPATRARA